MLTWKCLLQHLSNGTITTFNRIPEIYRRRILLTNTVYTLTEIVIKAVSCLFNNSPRKISHSTQLNFPFVSRASYLYFQHISEQGCGFADQHDRVYHCKIIFSYITGLNDPCGLEAVNPKQTNKNPHISSVLLLRDFILTKREGVAMRVNNFNFSNKIL